MGRKKANYTWHEQLEQQLQKNGQHPAWGIDHCRRVYHDAVFLGHGKADEEILLASAMLHDFGAYTAYKQEGIDHALRSIEVAPDLLKAARYPEHKIASVISCIRGHMYYEKPENLLEAQLFHDADTLDFMGSIGIARVFSIVGLDDWTPDLPAAVKLVEKFANELYECLTLPGSRIIGYERKLQMKGFVNSLYVQTHEAKFI